MSTKKAKSVKKPILYLHVSAENKAFFQKTARLISAKAKARITESAVADRLLTKLKANKKLLAQVLK